jgi:hypothetical protein
LTSYPTNSSWQLWKYYCFFSVQTVYFYFLTLTSREAQPSSSIIRTPKMADFGISESTMQILSEYRQQRNTTGRGGNSTQTRPVENNFKFPGEPMSSFKQNRWVWMTYDHRITSPGALTHCKSQMFAIILIKLNLKLKRCHHFPFHCKTTKFCYFEQQICQINTSPSCPDCQNRQLNMSSSISDLQFGRLIFSSIVDKFQPKSRSNML